MFQPWKWYHHKCIELSVSLVKYFDSELEKVCGDRCKHSFYLRETVRTCQDSCKSLSISWMRSCTESLVSTLEDIKIKIVMDETKQYGNDLLLKHNQ